VADYKGMETKKKQPCKRFLSVLQFSLIFFRLQAGDYKGMETKKKPSHKRFLSILQVLIIFFRFWVADYKGMEAQAKFLETGGLMDKYFNTKELSEYLRVPEQTIRRWVLDNEIAYVRIHNLIRFRLSEIEKWVDGKKGNGPSLPESRNELFGGAETGSLTETVADPEIANETEVNE
jgi:excisionase family DNA binding protein